MACPNSLQTLKQTISQNWVDIAIMSWETPTWNTLAIQPKDYGGSGVLPCAAIWEIEMHQCRPLVVELEALDPIVISDGAFSLLIGLIWWLIALIQSAQLACFSRSDSCATLGIIATTDSVLALCIEYCSCGDTSPSASSWLEQDHEHKQLDLTKMRIVVMIIRSAGQDDGWVVCWKHEQQY